jgi:magnesium chelatase family protein
MRVVSYMRQGLELVPVQVELTLAPGLPQILFLGLPDMAVRESALRIRSALRKQGFRLPPAQQVLVHLRPNHLRKTSKGLDLAVAAALLWETEQIPPLPPPNSLPPVLYGELTLNGEVEAPDDAAELESDQVVITGVLREPLGVSTRSVPNLAALKTAANLLEVPAASLVELARPSPKVSSFSQPAADVATVVAAGEHAALFAGPAGSGKSTLADSVPAWLDAPHGEDLRWAKIFARSAKSLKVWRPIVRPHHSITPLAMIGGGAGGRVFAGDISRANTGVLILDELLEFHSEIQEAMREPIETGTIAISRFGISREFAARFLLLSTTNLCHCGKFVPRTDTACTCSKRNRQKILSRLSGPFADRFAILAYSDTWEKKGDAVSSCEILSSVQKASEFRLRTRGQTRPNAYLHPADIEATLSSFQISQCLQVLDMGSRRRRDAVLRVARTCADIALRETIDHEDLDKALSLSFRGHKLLEDWRE